MRIGEGVAVAVLSSVVLSGCVGGGGGSKAPDAAGPGTSSTVPTSVVLDARSAPTVAPTTAVATTSSVLPKGLDTMEAASQNLWDAWRDDDRARALLYATPEAVDALFPTKWGPEVQNQGCGRVEGVARCVYTLRGGARVVVMSQSTDGFFTQRIETVGDLPRTNRLESEIVDDTVVFDTGPTAESGEVGQGTLGTEGSAGLDPSLGGTLQPGVATAPTVPDAAGSGSSKVTRRPRAKTTSRRKPRTTASTDEAPLDTPTDQAPSPVPEVPSPSPEAGPVPVGGRTVDTVAP